MDSNSNLLAITDLRKKQYSFYLSKVTNPVSFEVWLKKFSPDLPFFLYSNNFKPSSLRYYVNKVEIVKD